MIKLSMNIFITLFFVCASNIALACLPEGFPLAGTNIVVMGDHLLNSESGESFPYDKELTRLDFSGKSQLRISDKQGNEKYVVQFNATGLKSVIISIFNNRGDIVKMPTLLIGSIDAKNPERDCGLRSINMTAMN